MFDDGIVLIVHRLPEESPVFVALNTTNRKRRTLDQTLDMKSHWIAVHARLQNILTLCPAESGYNCIWN